MEPAMIAAFESFKRMAKAQVSFEDILFFLKITEEELEVIFKKEFGHSVQEVYQSARKEGQILLKQAQYEAAIAGDRTMLTLLGKEYLGQGKDAPPDNADGVVIMLPPLKEIGGTNDNK